MVVMVVVMVMMLTLIWAPHPHASNLQSSSIANLTKVSKVNHRNAYIYSVPLAFPPVHARTRTNAQIAEASTILSSIIGAMVTIASLTYSTTFITLTVICFGFHSVLLITFSCLITKLPVIIIIIIIIINLSSFNLIIFFIIQGCLLLLWLPHRRFFH